MKGWNVYSVRETAHGTAQELIDTVFYDDSCKADYVRRGLIGHDGYPSDIIISLEGPDHVTAYGADGYLDPDAECMECGEVHVYERNTIEEMERPCLTNDPRYAQAPRKVKK